MRRIIPFALSACAAAFISFGIVSASQEASPLPPLEMCEANNYKLRVATVQQQAEIARLNGQVAELQARLLAIEANNEKTRLEEKYRELMKPSAGTQFNWNTFRFDAPAPGTVPK